MPSSVTITVSSIAKDQRSNEGWAHKVCIACNRGGIKCTNSARWSIYPENEGPKRPVPVCRLHANRAERNGDLLVDLHALKVQLVLNEKEF